MRTYTSAVIFLIFFITFSEATLFSQNFIEEVKQLKALDQKEGIDTAGILFIGSSSFVLWPDVAKVFNNPKIVNRAFGGSTLLDQQYHIRDIVFPHRPRHIIIYCGENDLALDTSLQAKQVLKRFKTFFKSLKAQLPQAHITFVSLKPSPARIHLMKKFDKSNVHIKKYLAKKTNTSFVDIYHDMLDAQGLPRKELFGDDMLHMNEKGYALWKVKLAPLIAKY